MTAELKTATEMLADKFCELIDRAAATMTDEEFKEAETKSSLIYSRIAARR